MAAHICARNVVNVLNKKQVQYAILELATNFWLLMLSIMHNYATRIIKQASLSHWVVEYNLKVWSAWDL